MPGAWKGRNRQAGEGFLTIGAITKTQQLINYSLKNSKQILPARGRGKGICEKVLVKMKNKTAAKLSITGFAAVFMFLKCQIQGIIP